MDIRVAVLCAASLAAGICPAQDETVEDDARDASDATLDAVLVTGDYPGPGLCKIAHRKSDRKRTRRSRHRRERDQW